MRLATNRTVNGAEQSQFHTVVCWNRLAELVAQYATRGRQVCVEGRLEYRTFTDDEGKERGAVEIVASDVQFLGDRGKAETAEAPAAGTEEVNMEDIPWASPGARCTAISTWTVRSSASGCVCSMPRKLDRRGQVCRSDVPRQPRR
jgi:single-strand DNA-binding protein